MLQDSINTQHSFCASPARRDSPKCWLQNVILFLFILSKLMIRWAQQKFLFGTVTTIELHVTFTPICWYLLDTQIITLCGSYQCCPGNTFFDIGRVYTTRMFILLTWVGYRYLRIFCYLMAFRSIYYERTSYLKVPYQDGIDQNKKSSIQRFSHLAIPTKYQYLIGNTILIVTGWLGSLISL